MDGVPDWQRNVDKQIPLPVSDGLTVPCTYVEHSHGTASMLLLTQTTQITYDLPDIEPAFSVAGPRVGNDLSVNRRLVSHQASTFKLILKTLLFATVIILYCCHFQLTGHIYWKRYINYTVIVSDDEYGRS